MALRMPRPITNASGVYHLNIRVPGDVAAKVKGTVVTLPVAGAQVTVRPSDKVIVSLRTKDPSLAKARFCEAESALSRHWDALRRGPVSLTHVQLVALAGECYRATVKAFEDDPNYMPEGYLRAARQFEADVAYWRKNGDDDAGDIGERDGLVLACLARPRGPQLLAYERSRDLNEFGIAVTYDDAISNLFGPEADELCRVRHIEVDAPTRLRLIREIAQAYRLLDRKLIRNAEGDYSPDENASRFPPFVPPPVKAAAPPSRSSRGGGVGMQRLFDRWREVHGPSLAASTLRRYGPAVTSLDVHTKGKDVRSLSEDDIWDWAHARVAGGASARTVNRNELVAIASILGWATTRDGKRLRADNPARGGQAAGAEAARPARTNVSQRGGNGDPDPRAIRHAGSHVRQGRRGATVGALDLRLLRRPRTRGAPSREGEHLARGRRSRLGDALPDDEGWVGPNRSRPRASRGGRIGRLLASGRSGPPFHVRPAAEVESVAIAPGDAGQRAGRMGAEARRSR